MISKLECGNKTMPRRMPVQWYSGCGVGRCKGCKHLEPGGLAALENLAGYISKQASWNLDKMLARSMRDSKTLARLNAIPGGPGELFSTMDAAKAWGIGSVAARSWLIDRIGRGQVIRAKRLRSSSGMTRDAWRINADPTEWLFEGEVRRQIRIGEAA